MKEAKWIVITEQTRAAVKAGLMKGQAYQVSRVGPSPWIIDAGRDTDAPILYLTCIPELSWAEVACWARRTYKAKRPGVTQGKVYPAFLRGERLFVINDNGNTMSPKLDMPHDHPNGPAWETYKEVPEGWFEGSEPQEKYDDPTQEEKTMSKLTIKDTTLINGTRVEDLSDDQLLDIIESEANKITRLNTLPINNASLAVNRMKQKHQDNIYRILQLLDAREE